MNHYILIKYINGKQRNVFTALKKYITNWCKVRYKDMKILFNKKHCKTTLGLYYITDKILETIALVEVELLHTQFDGKKKH